MKALLTQSSEGGVKVHEKFLGQKENQVPVLLLAAALNHRDRWISLGQYPGIKPNTILGSDAVGMAQSGQYAEKRVIINPNVNWGNNPSHQSADYQILGTPNDGVFIGQRTFDSDRLEEVPDYLTNEEAAALPLAGMTAYRALFTKGEVSSASKILITGGGGGVAHLAILFACAIGAEVYATTGTTEKQILCESIGAKRAFNYKSDHWLEEAMRAGPFDVIIDSSGGDYLNSYLRLCKPGGKIVMYGSTLGKTPKFDTHRLFWSQISLIGSTMATDSEFKNMLAFVTRHRIRPIIDKVYRLEDFQEALDRFVHPDHFGKIIFDLQLK